MTDDYGTPVRRNPNWRDRLAEETGHARKERDVPGAHDTRDGAAGYDDAAPSGDALARDEEDPTEAWQVSLYLAERSGRTTAAERERKGGPPPGFGIPPRSLAPTVLAVEVGGDPGGAIGVALAAIEIERLSVVIVAGGRESARFTRHLLDLLGRDDVTVAASSSTPTMSASSISGLTPSYVPAQSTDVRSAVTSATGSTPYLVLWGNCGPLTDLAFALADDPTLRDRLAATVAAGPFENGPTAPFHTDPAAAASVIATLRRPRAESCDPRAAARPTQPPSLITADPARVALAAGSPLHRKLTAEGIPAWARLLGEHLDQWFALGHTTSSQYPALTVAELVQRPIIESVDRPVVVDSAGRVRIDPAGTVMATTRSLREWLAVFTEWLDRRLSEAMQTNAAPDA